MHRSGSKGRESGAPIELVVGRRSARGRRSDGLGGQAEVFEDLADDREGYASGTLFV